MKYELNFYKPTGKWYTSETTETGDLEILLDYPFFKDMDYTIHIVESDGFLQPFRMCKR